MGDVITSLPRAFPGWLLLPHNVMLGHQQSPPARSGTQQGLLPALFVLVAE